MTEEKKDGLLNTGGFFVGKELAGEGEKNGKAWKRYKAKFKPRVDSEKSFSFTAFTPLNAKNTKQLEDLEEGKEYRICYKEEERTHGPTNSPYMSKTVIGFYSATGEKGKGFTKETATAKPELTKFDSFKERYLAAMKKDGRTPEKIHMLGSFLASHEAERVKDLLAECETALKS